MESQRRQEVTSPRESVSIVPGMVIGRGIVQTSCRRTKMQVRSNYSLLKLALWLALQIPNVLTPEQLIMCVIRYKGFKKLGS